MMVSYTQNIIFLIPVIACLVVTATSDKSTQCKTVNNYYGPDQVPHDDLPSQRGLPGKRGRPGVEGPMGDTGPSGLTGQKGEKGEVPAHMAELIANLTSRIQTLETILPKLGKTCAHIYDATMESGYYLISPNPAVIKPFYVYCNFSVGDEAYTAFGHDSEQEISVTKCQHPRCYSRDINYDYTMEQMREVVQQSLHCRQYVKYKCQGSVFNWPNQSPYVAWRTYDGQDRYNWGGSHLPKTCECGVTGSCLRPTDKCNCDKNDEINTTSDDGYLNEKQYLPVTNLKFGDTDGADEAGWHTLGKLECYGILSD